MPTFDLDCPLSGEAVVITLDGFEVHGAAAFRGFACENESICHKAGIECALFAAHGPAPFDVAEALKFLGHG